MKLDFRKAEYLQFSIVSLFFVALGFLAIILTILGIFYPIFFILYLVLGIAFLGWLFFSRKIACKFDRNKIFIFFIILISIPLFLNFSSPTIFSGRDQGSLSETAIRLVQNHRLEFSTPASQEFFKIYGVGKALNFPGFDYLKNGNLKTDFPIGYPTWLGVFYALFGLLGFQIANGISFLLFLLAFYYLISQVVRKNTALWAFLAVVTSFVFSWFIKFTLSENLAWMLFWLFILQAYLFFKNENKFHLFCALLPLGLLLFVRIEALAFLVMFILVLFFRYRSWKKIGKFFGKTNLITIGSLVLLYLLNIWVNFESYLSLGKSIVKPFLRGDVGTGIFLGISPTVYVFKLFTVYGIIFFVAFLLLAIFILLRQKEKNWLIFLPLILSLPGFFYLFSPNISLDHPWMLRRFVFSTIPICIFYTFIFADRFFAKKRFLFYSFSGLILISNLAVTLLFLTFIPHADLASQINSLSQNFKANDLVLVDKAATGDGWSMLSGPMNFLDGKQAVYFFNLTDLAKIDQQKFNAIYFIIPDDSLDFYRQADFFGKLQSVKDYSLENPILDVSSGGSKNDIYNSTVNLPLPINNTTYGKIYRLIP